MKKTFAVIFGLILLVASLGIVFAQELPTGNRNEEFRRHFQEVVRLNSDVPDFKQMKPGTAYKLPDGTTDILEAGDVNGIWGKEFQKFYNTPKYVTSTSAPETKPVQVIDENYTTAMLWNDFGWLLPYIIVGLILLLGLWRLILSLVDPVPDFGNEDKEKEDELFELSKDPVLSGAPYVPFGIQSSDKRRLEEFMNFMAMAEYEAMEPKNKIERPIRIGPIEQGMVAGTGFVGYLGGLKKPRRIKEPGIRAYRAMYQFQDGSRFSLVCLQGCMNPVYSGGDLYKGFTFVPDPIKEKDEVCRGKNVAEQEADFFGETIPIKSTPTTGAVASSAIMDAVAQVPEHQYHSGGQSGGHRANRYLKSRRFFDDEF